MSKPNIKYKVSAENHVIRYCILSPSRAIEIAEEYSKEKKFPLEKITISSLDYQKEDWMIEQVFYEEFKLKFAKGDKEE